MYIVQYSVNVSGVPYVSKQKPSPFAFLLLKSGKARSTRCQYQPQQVLAGSTGDRGICGRTVWQIQQIGAVALADSEQAVWIEVRK